MEPSNPMPAILRFNSEEITVPAEQITGKTIAQVFKQHAKQLNLDTHRTVRYVQGGTVVSGDYFALNNRSYRCAYTPCDIG
jgi:hypothetical protein